MHKEVRELAADLVRQGWRVEVRKSGHLRAYSPDGNTIVTLPGTPSDRRWRQNAIRDLRRGGYDPDKPRKARGEGRKERPMKTSYRIRLSTAPLSIPVDDDSLDAIVAAVERQRGIAAPIIAANGAIRSLTLTASVDDTTPVDAIAATNAAFTAALRKAGIEDVEFVEVSAEVEDATGDRQELLAGAEVARRLGISRERVRQLATKPGRFPTAVTTVGTYRVWRWGDVTDWARANERPVKRRGKRTRAA